MSVALLGSCADHMGASPARAVASRNVIELGFLGSPPMLDAPQLFAAFAYLHAEAEVSFRELPYPIGSTANWLEEVDVALCFSPTSHPEVHIQPLRVEPRVVVAASNHPLAQREELTPADVLDETFPGTHPSVDPLWAGFWQLDDLRGEPPPHGTTDDAINPQELAAIIASGRAITTTPASDATNINPLTESLVVAAKNLADAAISTQQPQGA